VEQGVQSVAVKQNHSGEIYIYIHKGTYVHYSVGLRETRAWGDIAQTWCSEGGGGGSSREIWASIIAGCSGQTVEGRKARDTYIYIYYMLILYVYEYTRGVRRYINKLRTAASSPLPCAYRV